MRGRAPTRYAPSWRWTTPVNIARHRPTACLTNDRLRAGARLAGQASRAGARSLFLQGIVPGQDLRETFSKMLGELLGDVHRTVLAAGAPDSNGQIAAIRLCEFADAPVQELDQIRDHAAHVGISREILDHRRVAAVEMAQRVLPVGVRQGAHVENEIRIARDA